MGTVSPGISGEGKTGESWDQKGVQEGQRLGPSRAKIDGTAGIVIPTDHLPSSLSCPGSSVVFPWLGPFQS